jgi:hypothetical protein
MSDQIDVLAIMARAAMDELPIMSAVDMKEARAAVAELIEATESIADHYDMDGYGPTAWKSLALEMADKARTALARVKGA